MAVSRIVVSTFRAFVPQQVRLRVDISASDGIDVAVQEAYVDVLCLVQKRVD